MEKQFNSVGLIKDFAPQLEKTSKSWYITASILALLIIFGWIGLYFQVADGHIVTGMRDHVVWGVYIINFIFFMGISYAGALICGAMHLFKTEWSKPIMRMGELMTVISLLIGPMFIIFCIGRLERLPFLFTHMRIQSPIAWDIIAVTTDLVGCFIYLYLSVIEDLALLRDQIDLKVPAWKKKLYKILALGYTATPEQESRLKRTRNIMAAMIIAIAITVYSVLAWIFGVTLQPGWHSTIFGPYFVVAAVYSGTAVMIIVMGMFRKIYKLQAYITEKHFINIGIILLVAAAFFGYFTFSDYLTKWYGAARMDAILIDRLFKDFYVLFIFAHYIGVFVSIIVMAIPKFRTIRNITIAAVITLVALWVNRYLIVVPTLETPYLPIQESRDAWVHYSATWVEISLTLSGAAAFCLAFMVASKIVPIVSISEMISKHKK